MNVYCDCHGNVKVAEIVNGKLVIRSKQHGENHMKVLVIDNNQAVALESTK